MKRISITGLALFVSVCGGQVTANAQSLQSPSAHAVVVTGEHAHDVSPPLRDVPSLGRLVSNSPDRPLRTTGIPHSAGGGVDPGLQSTALPLIGVHAHCTNDEVHQPRTLTVEPVDALAG